MPYSGFFNSVDGEPEYGGFHFAAFAALITRGQSGYISGLFDELEVAPGVGLQSIVGAGGAFLGIPAGKWYYDPDGGVEISHDPETVGYLRIDRIILRADNNLEELNVQLVKLVGTPAVANPSPPELTQNETVFEIALAQVLVTGGSTDIEITDERDTEYCGRILLNGQTQEKEITDNHTLTFNDIGKRLKCNKATAMVITLPLHSSTPIPVDAEFAWYQYGAGELSFVKEDPSINIRSANDAVTAGTRYATGAIIKLDTDEWLITGFIS